MHLNACAATHHLCCLPPQDECNQQKTQAACEKLKVVPINIGKYKDAPSLLRMTAETAPNCRL